MPMPNIFESDLFSVNTLTAAINEAEYVPTRTSELGWFEEEGITTTSLVVEKDGDSLGLVEAKARGADGSPVAGTKRSGIPFETLHLPERATIMADEVQGVRQFGSEDSTQGVQQVVNQRLAKMRRRIDATMEFHRMRSLQGKILNADGTELVDLLSRFGVTQHEVYMDLENTSAAIEAKSLDILEVVEGELGAWPFSGVRVLCEGTFWRKLITNKRMRETYLNQQQAAQLRGDPREAFMAYGIMWERYRGGSVGGQKFIPAGEAIAVPEGVPELLITRFAPADYNEAVNSVGLPYYAKAEPMRFNKGVELESQSNPLSLCTRPKAVIRLHEGAVS